MRLEAEEHVDNGAVRAHSHNGSSRRGDDVLPAAHTHYHYDKVSLDD